MEGKIILALEFNVVFTSSYRYYERLAHIFNYSEASKQYCLGLYLLELSLMDYRFLKYTGCNQACSAMYLVNKIFACKDCWGGALQEHFAYSEEAVRPCAKDMCLLLQNIANGNSQAVRRKFMAMKFGSIASIKLERIEDADKVSQS